METLKQSTYNFRIIELLRKKPLSIAEIGRELNLNRSTLRYYLGLLRAENFIEYERQNNLAGRPTYIKINEEYFEKQEVEFKAQIENYRKEMFSNPITKKVLELLHNKNMGANELITQTQKISQSLTPTSETIFAIKFLESHHLIREYYEITPEGREFLKQNERH